ncbi:hypothetical protein BHM03_00033264 [Ensete ventricosum]|nr:hypothetical protein BHM03_00033264 [Ensete ventricosum]
MRVRLDTVPESEWVCEECRLKEAQTQMVGKFGSQLEAIEAVCSSENSQSIESTSNSLPGVENKAVDLGTRKDNKELDKLILSIRTEEKFDVTEEKISEACGASTGTTVSRNPTLLACDSSINKSDLVKVKLPALVTSCGQSEGWNKLFYLWGVFRGRNISCFTDSPDLEEKPSVSSLNLEPKVQDQSIPDFSGLCSSHDMYDKNSQELSRFYKFAKAKASMSSSCTNIQDFPTSGNKDRILYVELIPPVQNLHLAVAGDKVLTEQTSRSCSASCPYTSVSQLPNVPVAYPEPKLQIDLEQLPVETENDLTDLKIKQKEKFMTGAAVPDDQASDAVREEALSNGLPSKIQPLPFCCLNDGIDRNTIDVGEGKRPRKTDSSPRLSPDVGINRNPEKPLAPAIDDGDDMPASLSLSLAFPATENPRTAKPTTQDEQLFLPDMGCIDTSFLLFGGYTDT